MATKRIAVGALVRVPGTTGTVLGYEQVDGAEWVRVDLGGPQALYPPADVRPDEEEA